jgi:drug/metabolite transporter (DMT)-like permease
MTSLVLLKAVKIDLKGKNLKTLILVALFCPCIYFIAETIGISNTTSSESGVVLACIPVASLVASTLILKKKPSKIQVTGILITLVGVIVTVLAVGMSSSLSPVGYMFLVVAVISYSLYCVFVDKAAEFSVAEITFVMLIAGAILCVALALVEAITNGTVIALIQLPFVETTFLTAILYQGIGCSVIAFFMSNIAIANIGVNRTSSFIGVATVVSILAGAVVLGETLTILQIAGAVVIIIGVYVANMRVKE